MAVLVHVPVSSNLGTVGSPKLHPRFLVPDAEAWNTLRARRETDPTCRIEVDRCRELLVQELTGRPKGFVGKSRLVIDRNVHPVLPHLRDRTA